MIRVRILLILIGISFSLTSIAYGNHPTLLLGTTTSTDNTGLLNYLAPAFQQDTGIELQWVSVGTGKALQLGKHCDVNVLMVHAPQLEKEFVREGYGIQHRTLFYNDFVLVGPLTDPAHIKNLPLNEALKTLIQSHAVFISRADHSGTYQKELELWHDINISPPKHSPTYLEAGQGMLATLQMAAEKNAYTLTDRGTFLRYQTMPRHSPLEIIVAGDNRLKNFYSIMMVNPEKCPTVSSSRALSFIQWMASKRGQDLINHFKLNGQPLFTWIAE